MSARVVEATVIASVRRGGDLVVQLADGRRLSCHRSGTLVQAGTRLEVGDRALIELSVCSVLRGRIVARLDHPT